MHTKYWILGGIAVLAVAAGWLFLRSSAEITNYPSGGVDIIAFGDSLVVGVGSTGDNDFVSLLSQKIGRPIINLGHSGDTTAVGLARVGDLDTYNPKIVIVFLGGNDYLRRVPETQTFENLSKIIEAIHGRGAIVLLLGVRGGLLRDNFEAEFGALAKKYHTAHVSNVLAGLFGNDKYMSDEIHPNDLGYERIAERVYPVLESLLK